MFPSRCLHRPWLRQETAWPGVIWPQAVSWAQGFPFKPATSLQQVPSLARPYEVILGFLFFFFIPWCPPTVCHLKVPLANHGLGLAYQGVQAGKSDATDGASQLGPPQVRGIFRPGEPSHRSKAKRHNMFWKVAGSSGCLPRGPGLNKWP